MKQWIVKGVIIALSGLAIWWSFATSPNEGSETLIETAAPPPKVRVVTVLPQAVRPTLRAFGTAQAKYTTTLSAETEGVILVISTSGETGSLAPKGTLLLQMDHSRQHARLKAAEATLGQMEVALVEESLKAEQAHQDWNRAASKGDPPAFLVREPQLEAARRNLANAKAAVTEAERDMTRTQLKAPFDALITRRLVSPGTFVQPGTALLELYSANAVEVRLPLSEAQWQQLPNDKTLLQTSPAVSLTSDVQTEGWIGKVLRIERHADPQTRQRAIIVEVRDPLNRENPLHPGTFVQAVIPGVLVERALKVPPSAVTDRGEVWVVTDNHLLARHKAKILATEANHLLLEPFDDGQQWRILMHPMLTYLPGMKVNPMEVGHDER